MKIKPDSGSFEPCPEYNGRAVCSDVTPLKTVQTQYGPKEKFRFVFEIDKLREDGSRFCVWSQPFTPSYHENAALRPFLRKWIGRELTPDEQKTFDLEELIGRAAQVTVIHEHVDGETYANIALIQPDKSADPFPLSGKYVRAKDRAPRDSTTGYQRAQPASEAISDYASIKVHVGRCKGLELRDLSMDQVQALVDGWLPGVGANPKPTADDKRLMAALDWWVANQQKSTADNLNY